MEPGAPSILIVEDNPDHALLARKALLREDGSRKVEIARQASDAIQRLAGEVFDLIVSDYDLPQMNGIQFIREVRSHGYDVPIVIVTGLGNERVAAEAMKAGAYDYITKTDNYLENLHRYTQKAYEKFTIEKEKERLELRLVEHSREVERANRELTDLEKLKNDLIGMIVHDLKAPVTVIRGVFGLLEATPAPDPAGQTARLLATGRRNVELLMGMITDLLDITCIEQGQLKLQLTPFSMGELAVETREFFVPVVTEKNAELAVEVAPVLPQVRGDRDKLRRVLMNLLMNALTYGAPELGRIGLRVLPEARTRGVRVEVSDNGPGIPWEYRERIFEKFFQIGRPSERKKHTTGLGLNFCKLVVESHAGRIWVESQLGSGSTFIFTLPGAA